MNGRVYNPTLARFVSADPLISSPDDTQNYNRYSYVHNRPMFFTDPSGFETADQTENEDKKEEEKTAADDANAKNTQGPEVITVTTPRRASNSLTGDAADELLNQMTQVTENLDKSMEGSFKDSVKQGKEAVNFSLAVDKLSKLMEKHDIGLKQMKNMINKTAKQTKKAIREAIEGVKESLTPTGVLSVGIESTSVFTVAGQKGGFGLFIDFDNKEAGTFVKSNIQLSGYDDGLAGGMEGQLAISFDVTRSIEDFTGESIESGMNAFGWGLDYGIVEGKGVVSGGFDIPIGPGGGGSSVINMKTETITHWRF